VRGTKRGVKRGGPRPPRGAAPRAARPVAAPLPNAPPPTAGRCNPTSISLKAGCELFLRYTTRTSALEMEDFGGAKARLIEVGAAAGRRRPRAGFGPVPASRPFCAPVPAAARAFTRGGFLGRSAGGGHPGCGLLHSGFEGLLVWREVVLQANGRGPNQPEATNRALTLPYPQQPATARQPLCGHLHPRAPSHRRAGGALRAPRLDAPHARPQVRAISDASRLHAVAARSSTGVLQATQPLFPTVSQPQPRGAGPAAAGGGAGHQLFGSGDGGAGGGGARFLLHALCDHACLLHAGAARMRNC
jgi:hypothetical protein